MKWLFSQTTFYLLGLMLMSSTALGVWLTYFNDTNNAVADTYVVDSGVVKETVSVTGKVDVAQVTRLGFPVNGTIQQIYKTEGDLVTKGEVIASIATSSLVAEYNTAYSNAEYFRQLKVELLEGATAEERSRSQTAIELAESERDLVVNTYKQLIKNAKKNLLSSGLKAYPVDPKNDDVPPVISGSYTCEEEGGYALRVYASNAPSNYSYVLTGLESGTYSANEDTPAKLGDCGLYIQFDDEEVYKTSSWEIPIPNPRSAGYITLKNEYDKLQAEYASKLAVAKEAVRLAQNEDQVVTARPTDTRLKQAEANYNQALSELTRLNAIIADHVIKAPFSGVVSDVSMKPGEAASPQHTVTVINAGDYILKALVPELKIVGVETGQPAEVYFDAAADRLVTGEVAFISPVSKNIGGVSYYETHIKLSESPNWLREGLNADIEIIVNEKKRVVIVPERYIINDGQDGWVLESTATGSNQKKVELGLLGTNNMVEVSGIDVGTKLILP